MSKHDKIATRLSLILIKLNNGEKLDPVLLAEEFGVTVRTIQRDLKVRFKNLSLKKEKKLYFLDKCYLGKLNFNDIKNFAMLFGIKSMFPSFSNDFLQTILNSKSDNPYIIKGHYFENLNQREKEFHLIENAIKTKNALELIYKEKERFVHPYKFANIKGIWYLIALQGEVIKTFTFSKIEALNVSIKHFEINSKILQTIEDEDSIWFSNTKIEVTFKVNSSIAQYFKRRKIIAYQKIIEEYEDGSLLVSSKMTFEEETLQFIRYWIPNIRIISPLYLQEKLEHSLKGYLKGE